MNFIDETVLLLSYRTRRALLNTADLPLNRSFHKLRRVFVTLTTTHYFFSSWGPSLHGPVIICKGSYYLEGGPLTRNIAGDMPVSMCFFLNSWFGTFRALFSMTD